MGGNASGVLSVVSGTQIPERSDTAVTAVRLLLCPPHCITVSGFTGMTVCLTTNWYCYL